MFPCRTKRHFTDRGRPLYFRPNTIQEAVEVLAGSGGQILSGGTDFFPALGDRPATIPVIDISALGELKGFAIIPDFFCIGGLTTWSEIINTSMPPCFDALKLAAREIGGVQIQNRGTIAGNLCNASPAADGVPPLLALDAEVELISISGQRRVPLSQFIVGNRKTLRDQGEILSRILVPRTVQRAASTFLKLGSRRYLVISIVMVAAIIEKDADHRIQDARVSVGSCSAVARRLPQLERDLVGMPARQGFESMVTAAHLKPLSPIADIRATATYRNDAALQLVRRALHKFAEDA